MTLYHYCVLTKPEAAHFVAQGDAIDMENVDYKRQPDVASVRSHVEAVQGQCCGIIRGGMFGLATNQIALLSAWENTEITAAWFEQLAQQNEWQLSAQEQLLPTVRPLAPEPMTRSGVYVIRWIRMQPDDIAEYTRLCLETWPRFEISTQSRCYGVFRPVENTGIAKLLMLTWYASLDDWEKSRQLEPLDQAKWSRRSEMELSHWAEAGRLATKF